jgi:hypothetical protein
MIYTVPSKIKFAKRRLSLSKPSWERKWESWDKVPKVPLVYMLCLNKYYIWRRYWTKRSTTISASTRRSIQTRIDKCFHYWDELFSYHVALCANEILGVWSSELASPCKNADPLIRVRVISVPVPEGWNCWFEGIRKYFEERCPRLDRDLIRAAKGFKLGS